jgi:ankyrin repeat protein
MSSLLLRHGANPSIPNRHGFPPLSIAIRGGYIAAARLLLSHNADPSLLSPGDGQAPLHQAVAIPHDELVTLLLAHDPAIVDTPNTHGHTPLDHAIMLGCPGAARALLDNGADMNAVDSHGDTVLHRALNICPRRGAMIRLLVEAGADLCSARDARGMTVLDVAAASGYSWVLETCEEFINARTPLAARL